MQATLANLPLDQVNAVYAKTDPLYAQYATWAEEALVTAVFCIIICGAFGTMAIRYLSPLLLDQVSLPSLSSNFNSCAGCLRKLHVVQLKTSTIHPYPSATWSMQ